MANKTYLVVPGTQKHYHNSKSEVHEHRAPTDDSIKLLRKMEKEARKQVEKSIRVTNTNFDCNILMQAEPWNAEYCILIMYTLNGTKRKVEARVKSYLEKNEMYEEIGRTVLEAVAKDISEQVLNNLSNVVSNTLRYKWNA